MNEVTEKIGDPKKNCEPAKISGGNQRNSDFTRFSNGSSFSNVPSFKTMAALWRTGFERIFELPMRQKQTKMFEFVRECLEQDILPHDILTFCALQENMHARKSGNAMHVDQLPSTLCISSSSDSNASVIFCAGDVSIQNGTVSGGAYGPASGMANETKVDDFYGKNINAITDVLGTSDGSPILYMAGHIAECVHKGKMQYHNDLAPYVLIFGDYDSRNGKKDPFDHVAKRQLARAKVLAHKLRSVGHSVHVDPKDSQNIEIWDLNGYPMFLLPLVHDINERKFFVVWDNGKKIESLDFSIFVKNRKLVCSMGSGTVIETPLADQNIVKKHLRNLDSYSKTVSAAQLTHLYGTCTHVCCVDSRSDAEESIGEGVMKIIGAYPTKDELKRKIGNPDREKLTIRLHTQCGYINIMIKIDTFFAQLRKSARHNALIEALNEIWFDLNRIMKGEITISHSHQKVHNMAENLKLSQADESFLCTILCGAGSTEDKKGALDLEMILKHVYNRGLISGSVAKGFRVEPVYTVKKFLKTNKLQPSGEQLAYLVTEEIGRQLIDSVKKVKGELGSNKEVKVMIQSFRNHGLYIIEPNLSLGNSSNFERRMFHSLDDDGNLVFTSSDVFLTQRDK